MYNSMIWSSLCWASMGNHGLLEYFEIIRKLYKQSKLNYYMYTYCKCNNFPKLHKTQKVCNSGNNCTLIGIIIKCIITKRAWYVMTIFLNQINIHKNGVLLYIFADTLSACLCLVVVRLYGAQN